MNAGRCLRKRRSTIGWFLVVFSPAQDLAFRQEAGLNNTVPIVFKLIVPLAARFRHHLIWAISDRTTLYSQSIERLIPIELCCFMASRGRAKLQPPLSSVAGIK